MFKEIEGGKKFKIQGLDCWTPPDGYVFNRFTNKLEPREIYSRSDDEAEQYWEIPAKPKDVHRKLIEEERQRQKSPEYFDVNLQAYREREWDRRVNGFWFYNNGVPTYITGLHYFYLAHWFIDIGYPHFRLTDLKWFYFWQYCVEDPDCFGMTEVTQRRQGKSFRAGAMLYEAISRRYRKRAGIQSKDKEAAEVFFDVHVAQPFSELEKLFKPTIDLDKGTLPKNELRLFKTVSRGINGNKKEEDTNILELRSTLDFQASKDKAYDGKKLIRYVRDEAGKIETVGANVNRAHAIVKPCLTDGEYIIGKALYTTTVEDMEDDDHPDGNFRTLWEDSDQLSKGKSGRTKSGLYRYFMAAYECMYFDKYGIPNEEKAKLFHQKERSNLGGNALLSYMRKYPFTIEEAFFTSRTRGIFNTIAIDAQRQEVALMNQEDLFILGNLKWEDGEIGGKVTFRETPKGRFKFYKKFNIFAECELQNSVVNNYGQYTPARKSTRIIGVDPVDHKMTSVQTVDGFKGSKASAHVFIKYNLNDELSEMFVCEYMHRPDDPEDFYSDMAILAFALGAEIIIENNKPGLINYLNRIGFEKFIVNFGNTQGIPASVKNQQLLAETYEIYIDNSLNKIFYTNILSDLTVFNLEKTTKFDAAMSSGWALVGAYGERVAAINKINKPKRKVYDISTIPL